MSNERCKQVRRDAIKLAQQYGGTHFGGSMSSVEIVTTLYDEVLTKHDVFILSKGHSCWPYYVLLREHGHNPKIESHPHIDVHNGVHCTTGSLGHGLPVGLGMALGKNINDDLGKIYILMGDGECQEGTLWESMIVANANKINNLVVIIDNNRFQGSGHTNNILPLPDMGSVCDACGWDYKTVAGHDTDALFRIFRISSDKPIMINADTTKGKGVSFMEHRPEWHSKPLLPDMERKAMEELV